MNILKIKDEILSAFGNIRAMRRLHVDTHTEEKIINIKGVKVAESKKGQFWVDFQELNGFLFMNSTILSHLDLRTTKGIKITILTDEFEIGIESDEKEIKSDFSNVSNTWITKVSYAIGSKEREIIEKGTFEEITCYFKKEMLSLRKV